MRRQGNNVQRSKIKTMLQEVLTRSSHPLGMLLSNEEALGTSLFSPFLSSFLAALGRGCCVRAFSSSGEKGYSLLQCVGFSLWWLLLWSTGSRQKWTWVVTALRFSGCGSWAYLYCGMWNIPGPGIKSREGDGTALQYSCLENPMDGGTWWAAVHGVSKSRT